MKPIALLSLVLLLLLPLAGCQTDDRLAQLPDSQEITMTLHGVKESVTAQKAQRDACYAIYYEAERLSYLPGDVIDGAFTDKLLAADDDGTAALPTGLYIHYEPNSTATEWLASLAPDHEFSPSMDAASPDESPAWKKLYTNKDFYQLGNNSALFLRWEIQPAPPTSYRYCYTSPYQDGVLLIMATYPREDAENWDNRLDATVRTLVLAE